MEGVSVFLGLVWKFSRVLVTGGAGFCGLHLVGALTSLLCVAGQSGLKGGKFKSLDGHVFW